MEEAWIAMAIRLQEGVAEGLRHPTTSSQGDRGDWPAVGTVAYAEHHRSQTLLSLLDRLEAEQQSHHALG